MPGCDGEMPLGSQRVCSSPDCNTPVHHACCAEWYCAQQLPDPEANQAFCWPCITKLYPERACDAENLVDGDIHGKARSSRGNLPKNSRSNKTTPGTAGSGGAAANPGNTSSRYTGAEFEAGRLRNVAPATLPLPGAAPSASPEPRRSSSEQQGQQPRRSPRTPEGAAQAAAEISQLQQELNDLAKLPWMGQTAKQDKTGLLIVSFYEHRIVPGSDNKKIIGGEVVEEPRIKFRTKYEPVEKERFMGSKGFNQTRLGEYLIDSHYTPDSVKYQIASVMRSGKAKAYVAKVDTEKHLARDLAASAADESRKCFKTDGGARAKQDADNCLITKYIQRDAAMPDDLFQLNMFLMTLFFLMCRVSFSVATSIYFRKFLEALRPSFEHKLPRGSRLRSTMAGVHLDEAYERAREITEEVCTAADCALHAACMLHAAVSCACHAPKLCTAP